MAFMMVLGECIGCGKMFTFNANKVPSIRVNGSREPVCKQCVDRLNPIRVAKGLEPIVPLPGAYEAEEVA